MTVLLIRLVFLFDNANTLATVIYDEFSRYDVTINDLKKKLSLAT